MGPHSNTGRPVKILRAKDNTFELDEAALERILLAEHVKNKPVALVSVAGAFRQGKSFLLGFFLRYLHNLGDHDWLGDPDAPLVGFEWKGGSERHTTGILLWDEVFMVTTPDGEEVAVLLMDTQGTFDSKSTYKENSTIFALSVLTSSVQIYNIMRNIQEDHLQHLQVFAGYGELALESHTGQPFQKLLLLVRDWQCPSEAEYGARGGQIILDRRLQITEKQDDELKRLRQVIRSSFSEISCFLMPHPGEEAATAESFNGRPSDISSSFIKQLKELVPSVLSPHNLVVKEMNGRKISCEQLVSCFKIYANAFQGSDLPSPKSIFEANVECWSQQAKQEAMDFYRKDILQFYPKTNYEVSLQALEDQHEKLFSEALKRFRNAWKWGGDIYSQRFEKDLTKDKPDPMLVVPWPTNEQWEAALTSEHLDQQAWIIQLVHKSAAASGALDLGHRPPSSSKFLHSAH